MEPRLGAGNELTNMNARRATRAYSRADHRTHPTIAERVEGILRSRELTLAEVSRQTAVPYGRLPHYFIPHNFYYDLGLPGYSPKIEQVLALSRVSNYRIVDWLTVFGLDLAAIARLQLEFPAARTSLIDSTVYAPAARIDWFEDATSGEAPAAVTPLSQLLILSHPRTAESFVHPGTSPFRYVKIGREDALVCPDLVPGSIVRADTRLERIESGRSDHIFLVEHARGIVCSRLQASTRGRVRLRTEVLPFALTELRLGAEVRILGVLDWELRPAKIQEPEVLNTSRHFLQAQFLPAPNAPATLRQVLERARSHQGLSFRGASAKSRWIAKRLGDPRYFCAPSSLAEYETRSRLPAHIHKSISLCILYSLGFWELLRAAGVDLGDAGHEPIPDTLVGRNSHQPREDSRPSEERHGFFQSLLGVFEEVPIFLRHSLPTFTGLPNLSLRDLFWTGGTSSSLHPLLKDAFFVSVNHRLKKPTIARRKSRWEQPLYVLLLRDGTYRLASCHIERRILLVDFFSDRFLHYERLHPGMDVEVVGRLTALLRRFR